MYLHLKTPVLEQPSELSRKSVEFKMNDIITFGEKDQTKLKSLKKAEGIAVDDNETKKKIKKKKQPNPLSCKKKKKKKLNSNDEFREKCGPSGVKEKNIDKKKRKRVRLPTHVKELLMRNEKWNI